MLLAILHIFFWGIFSEIYIVWGSNHPEVSWWQVGENVFAPALKTHEKDRLA